MLPEVNVPCGWTSFKDLILYMKCLEEKIKKQYILQEERIEQLEKENEALLAMLKQLQGGTENEQSNS